MSYQRDLSFGTARGIVEYLMGSTFYVNSVIEANWQGKRGYLFRGLHDAKFSNIPSVLRDNMCSSRFAPQFPTEWHDEHWGPYLGMRILQEMRAVHVFLENADKLGIATPIDYSSEKSIFENHFPRPSKNGGRSRLVDDSHLDREVPDRML